MKLLKYSSARYCFIENLFETGTMCESEYLVLSEWFNYLVSSPQLDFHVDRIIYLRTDPEVAYERIRKRNRTEENTIPFQLVKGKFLIYLVLLARVLSDYLTKTKMFHNIHIYWYFY